MVEPRRIGRYEVVRTLGQGGMGVVLEVRDPAAGDRALALKLITSPSPTLEARFVREAEVLAKVAHRNVVRIHDFGKGPEGLFILQELVEGQSLHEQLSRQGALSPHEAARIGRELADALAAVHRKGVLHRDLKPANVILRSNGLPVLLDFGMARDEAALTLTNTGAFLGTPSYMSPEQADGRKDLDGRTDVYGLGAVLYELLTGQKPFSGATVNVLHSLLSDADPPWPATLSENVPAGLDAVVRRCMAKAPEGRYADMEELREDLDRFLAGRAPLALAEQHQRQRHLLPWIGGGLLTLALLGGALAMAMSPEARPPAAASRRPAPPSAEVILFSGLRLWDAFNYRYEFTEDNGETPLLIGGVHRAEVTAIEGDRLTLRCTSVSIRMKFGTLLAGFPFDTDDPVDPNHPLSGVRDGLGRSFQLVVDRRSGALLECRGMKALRLPIARAMKIPELGPGLDFSGVADDLLTDARIATTLDSLWHVQGGPLPWRSSGGAGDYALVARKHSVLNLPKTWRPSQLQVGKDVLQVNLEGTAHFRNGRPVASRIDQTLEAPPLKSSWSYELLQE